MKKTLTRVLLMAGLLAATFVVLVPRSQPARAASSWITPEFVAARDLIQAGLFNEGAQAFLDIAAKNPGSELAVHSLRQAVQFIQPGEKAIPILQQIIQQYPGTRYEVDARMNLLWLQGGAVDNTSMVRGADQIAQSLGGPSLQDILKADLPVLNRLTTQVQGLPQDAQSSLYGIYKTIATSMHYGDRSQTEAVLNLDAFRRQTFAHTAGADQCLRDLEVDICRVTGLTFGPGVPMAKIDPTVRVRPHQGHFGPQPRFSLELSTGPYPGFCQVDLLPSKFLLDGQDFYPQLQVRSHVDLDFRRREKRTPFEILRLSGRPAQPLAGGPHTLDLEIYCEGRFPGQTGPGLTTKHLTFEVRKAYDDPDDERNDNWDQEWDD